MVEREPRKHSDATVVGSGAAMREWTRRSGGSGRRWHRHGGRRRALTRRIAAGNAPGAQYDASEEAPAMGRQWAGERSGCGGRAEGAGWRFVVPDEAQGEEEERGRGRRGAKTQAGGDRPSYLRYLD